MILDAFNALNRSVALHNVKYVCPSVATILHNCYSSSNRLYIGGETICAEEGVSQGDPLAMPFYAISMIPLIDHLTRDVTQV